MGRASWKGGLHFDASPEGLLIHIPPFFLDTPDTVSPPLIPDTHSSWAEVGDKTLLPDEMWVDNLMWLLCNLPRSPFLTCWKRDVYIKGTLELKSPSESRLSWPDLDTVCEQETDFVYKQAFLGLFTILNTARDKYYCRLTADFTSDITW